MTVSCLPRFCLSLYFITLFICLVWCFLFYSEITHPCLLMSCPSLISCTPAPHGSFSFSRSFSHIPHYLLYLTSCLSLSCAILLYLMSHSSVIYTVLFSGCSTLLLFFYLAFLPNVFDSCCLIFA